LDRGREEKKMKKNNPLKRACALSLMLALFSGLVTQGIMQPVTAGDIAYTLNIDPTRTATQNMSQSRQDSGLDSGIDSPGPANTFTGQTWEQQGNIKVLDNRVSGGVKPYPLVQGNGIFDFFLHQNRDYDGNNTDRQRIEIKGGNNAHVNTRGYDGDIITYNWKFFMPHSIVNPAPVGFFHIFQLKAMVGGEAGAPLGIFTISTGGQLQFRQVSIGANMNTAQTFVQVPMSSLTGKWLEADVTAHFSDNGYMHVRLVCVQTGTVYMNHGRACDMWRRPEIQVGGQWVEGPDPAPANQFIRPKWGLYRSIGAQATFNQSRVGQVNMMFADCRVVKRNRNTYVFPDGYSPNGGGSTGSPDDFTLGLQPSSVKVGRSTGDNVMNLFNDPLSDGRWSSGRAGAEHSWVAVDLGQTRTIGEVILNFQGGNDRQRANNVTMAVSNSASDWNALVAGSSGTAYPLNVGMGRGSTAKAGNWVNFYEVNGTHSSTANTITADSFVGGAAAAGRYAIMVFQWQPVNETDTTRSQILDWRLKAGEPDDFTLGLQSPGVKVGRSTGDNVLNLFNDPLSDGRWSSGRADAEHSWVAVDLGKTRTIREVVLNFQGGNDRIRANNVTMAVSDSLSDWNALVAGSSGTQYPLGIGMGRGSTAKTGNWKNFYERAGTHASTANTITVGDFVDGLPAAGRYAIMVFDWQPANTGDSGRAQILDWRLKKGTAPRYGHVRGESDINAADVTLLRGYIAAQDKTAFRNANPAFSITNADVNGDGFINSADVTLLRRWLAAVEKSSVPLGPRP
jgi:hypothetical protein